MRIPANERFRLQESPGYNDRLQFCAFVCDKASAPGGLNKFHNTLHFDPRWIIRASAYLFTRDTCAPLYTAGEFIKLSRAPLCRSSCTAPYKYREQDFSRKFFHLPPSSLERKETFEILTWVFEKRRCFTPLLRSYFLLCPPLVRLSIIVDRIASPSRFFDKIFHVSMLLMMKMHDTVDILFVADMCRSSRFFKKFYLLFSAFGNWGK